jgi:hypothetical protein
MKLYGGYVTKGIRHLAHVQFVLGKDWVGCTGIQHGFGLLPYYYLRLEVSQLVLLLVLGIIGGLLASL